MALDGETILLGAPDTCDGEGFMPHEPQKMVFQICQSAAGFFVGTECDYCGPYTRESGYYGTYDEAELAFQSGNYGR